MLSRLTAHVHGTTDFDDFPIPFTAIATRLADFMMQPEIGDFGMMDFDDVAKILTSADVYVAQYRNQLQQIADSQNALRSDPGKRHRFRPERVNRIMISEIEFLNPGNIDVTILFSELQLLEGGSYTIADIEMAVDRVFSLPFFNRVTYQLEPVGDDTRNAVEFTQRGQEVRLDATQSLKWADNAILYDFRIGFNF